MGDLLKPDPAPELRSFFVLDKPDGPRYRASMPFSNPLAYDAGLVRDDADQFSG